MIDILWKLVGYWSLYETARYVIVLVLRSEIGRIANTKTSCRRCQWRLFCTRTAVRLQAYIPPKFSKHKVSLVLFGMAIGNGDSILIIVRKLLEERKALNVRQKSNVPRPRL